MSLRKKLLPGIIAVAAVAICLFMLPTEAKAASESDLTFTLNSDGESYSITDCKASATGKLTIPAIYNGKPVTSIRGLAFSGCTELTNIIIPDSVVSIDGEAFNYCIKLTSITIPDSVISIGDAAFRYCAGLTTFIVDGNNPNYANDEQGVLYNKDFTEIVAAPIKLTGRYTIPNSVISIAGFAFEGCTGLTRITIPNSVTSIGRVAFADCIGLTSVTIPDSVTSIGSAAFQNCTNLKYNIYSNAKYLGNDSNPYVCLIKAVSTDVTSCIINANTKFIYQGAFAGCTGLTSINIPDSVASIGDYAFRDCAGLTSISIPNSVTSVGSEAFNGCDSLNSVYINDLKAWCNLGFVEDMDSPMYYAENLYLNNALVTDLVIPSGITSIRPKAFYGCDSIASVTIGNDVDSIGDGAFALCQHLSSVTIGDSVTSIGASAFAMCPNVNQVTLGNHVVSIGPGAFSSCSSVIEITIPDSVTDIGANAFAYCYNLRSIAIPNSISNIGMKTFRGCVGLTSVTIPDSVTSIGESAFYDCINLKTVFYSGTATQKEEISTGSNNNQLLNATWHYGVREMTFADQDCYYCPTCDDYFLPNGEQAKATVIFKNWDGSVLSTRQYSYKSAVTIPANPTKAADNTYTYTFAGWDKEVVACAGNATYTATYFATCLYKYSVADGEVTITGYIGNGGAVTIPDAIDGMPVTSIGSGAFASNKSVISIIIPSSITNIAGAAFVDCSGLANITIGNNVTSIGSDAFAGCSNLTSITIPRSVTSIAGSAFVGCHKLTRFDVDKNNPMYTNNEQGLLFSKDVSKLVAVPSGLTDGIVIPNSVTHIGEYAFAYSKITSITIPDSVINIGQGAFAGCNNLATIAMGNGLASIGYQAFLGCSGLTSITIPDSVTSIGNQAFDGCTGLKGVYINDLRAWCELNFGHTVNPLYYAKNLYLNNALVTDLVIPDGITSIRPYAFYNCTSITSVTIGNDVDSIGGAAFLYCTGLSSVTIGNSVTSIGNGAFAWCSNITQIAIGNHVTSIGTEAFIWCSNLSSIIIPDSIANISTATFYGCDNLTSVFYRGNEEEKASLEIDEGNDVLLNATWHYEVVETVFAGQDGYYCAECDNYFLPDGSYALATVVFKNWDGSVISTHQCPYKGAVTLPVNPQKAADNTYTYAFAGWDNEVTACTGNATYTATYTRHRKDGLLYSVQNGEVTITGYEGSGGALIIPETIEDLPVTSIRGTAFYGCTNLTSVTINACITRVGDDAFYGCTNLTEVSLINGFNGIGSGMFQDCTNLTSISIPGSVTSFGGGAFRGCTSLASVVIPNSVTSIGDYVFADCTKLTDVVIPSSVTKIYNAAFAGCNNLTNVTYCGTPEQWSAINYGFGNEALMDATLHFHNCENGICTHCGYIAVYTIIFKDWDGREISSAAYHYGEAVAMPADPTRPDDNDYSYTFTGWNETVTICTGNAIYTATYSSKSLVPETITSNKYTVSSGVISKIEIGTKVSALIGNLNEGEYVKIFNGTTEVSGDALIGTGMVVKIMDGDTVVTSVTVVVTGDTNGDGKLTVTDFVQMQAHLLNKTPLQGAAAKAADTSGDGKTTVTDYVQIQAHILGKSSVQPRSIAVAASASASSSASQSAPVPGPVVVAVRYAPINAIIPIKRTLITMY